MMSQSKALRSSQVIFITLFYAATLLFAHFSASAN
jgi:hypothetical protein